MAEHEDDLTLRGDLDNALVLKALDDIVKAATDMERSGNENFIKIAKQAKLLAVDLAKDTDEVSRLGRSFKNQFTKEGVLSITTMRKALSAMAGDLKSLAKDAADVSLGTSASKLFEDIQRVELEDIIETGQVFKRIEELEDLIEKLKNSTVTGAVEMGAALEANLNAVLQEGTRSTSELNNEIKGMLTTGKQLSSAFASDTTIDLTEQLGLTKAQRELDRLIDLGRMFREGEFAVGQEKAFEDFANQIDVSAEKLVDLFSRGQISQKEFEAGVRNLGKSVDESLKAFSVSELQPFAEVLGLREANVLFNEIHAISDKLQENLRDEAVEAGEALLEKIFELNDQLGNSVLTQEQYTKALKGTLREAKALDEIFKEAGEPTEVINAAKAAEAVRILADMNDQFVQMGDNATSLSGFFESDTEFERMLANLMLVRNEASEIEDRFNRGQITATEFNAKIKELANEWSKFTASLVSAELQPIESAFQFGEGIDKATEIEEIIQRLTVSLRDGASEAAEALVSQLSNVQSQLERGLITQDQFNKLMAVLVGQAKTLNEEFRETADTDIAQGLRVDRILSEVDAVKRSFDDLDKLGVFRGLSDEMKEFIDVTRDQADNLGSLFTRGQISEQEFNRGILELRKNTKVFFEELQALAGEDSVWKQQVVDLTLAELQAAKLTTTLEKMARATDEELVTASQLLPEVIESWGKEYDSGIISLTEYQKKLDGMARTMKRLQSVAVETVDSMFSDDIALGEAELGVKRILDRVEGLKEPIENVEELWRQWAEGLNMSDLLGTADEGLARLGNEVKDQVEHLQNLQGTGQISTKEFSSEIALLEKRITNIFAAISEGDLKPIEDALRLQDATESASRLTEKFERFGDVLSGSVADRADLLKQKVEELLLQADRKVIGPEELAKGLASVEDELSSLITEFNRLEELDISDRLQLAEAEVKFQLVTEAANRLMSSTSDAAKTAGKDLKDAADLAQKGFRDGRTEVDGYAQSIGKLDTKARSLGKQFALIAKKDVFKDIDTTKAQARISRLEDTIVDLGDSTDENARRMGMSLQQAALQSIDAWQRNEIEVGDLNKRLKELIATGQEVGRTYGEEMPDKTDRATVSVWKMSRALDSVGVRGLGGVLRIVDAIKGIPPVAIVTIVSLLAVAKAVQLITKAVASLVEKAGKAFFNLSKDALELAKNYEVVELQLRGIFKGKADLARATLKKIMMLGAQLGVDLSGRLTQVFLPLVENFKQFEALAKAAATLSVKTGKDMQEVSRALGQATAGQFKSLQFQFAVTGDHIENIKKKQELLGDTAGLIAGMEDYFEATGTGWDAFENSLSRVQGQLTETFNLFKFQLGEPIKIALTEQLIGIRMWIDDNGDMIEQFFGDIGESLSTVITAVGEFGERFSDAMDAEDIDSIATSFQILSESIADVFNAQTTDSMEDIVDLAVDLALELSLSVIHIRRIVNFLKFGAQGAVPGAVAGAVAAGAGTFGIGVLPGAAIGGAAGFLGGGALGSTITEESEEIDEALAKLEERRKELDLARSERRALGPQPEDNLDDAIDEALSPTARQDDLVEQLQEAGEEIADAYRDLSTDVNRDLRDLGIEAGREIADTLIENSRKREDLLRKHRERLVGIADKTGDKIRDALVGFKDSEIDIAISNARKLSDIAIEEAKKKEDLEEKHQERLLKIRDKFAFDAREAIRQNDAVAFFRLLRRLEFELNQEQDKHRDSVQDADEAAEDKREKLNRQLKREEEDLDKSLARKMRDIIQQHKDELEAEKEKYELLIEQQNIQEERKSQDFFMWLKREREDFNTMLHDKLQDLEDNMADQITVYKDTLDEINAINAEIAQSMVSGLGSVFQSFFGGNIFGTLLPPQLQFLIGGGTGINTGGIGGLVTDQPGAGGQPATDSQTTGTGGQATESQLRSLAVSLAKEQFVGQQLVDMFDFIAETNYEGLVHLISDLQSHDYGSGDVPTATLPPKEHGGVASANTPYEVGERGTEVLIPAQAGIIAPHAPFMAPSQAQPNVSSVIDNSRNISASIDLLDPTQVSEIQKTLWRAAVTEQLLAIEGGG